MDDLFNAHDLMHIGAYVVSLVVAVAVLKRDLFWLRKSFEEHRQDDKSQFEAVHQDIRELRRRYREAD